MKFGSNINLSQNELQNAVLQNLASEPSNPKKGQMYFNTTTNLYGIYNGTTWTYLKPDPNSVTKSVASTAQGKIQVSAGANREIQDFSTTDGIVKVNTDGVAELATKDVDYVSPNGNVALTNKTIDANSNTVQNLDLSNFETGVIDTDSTMSNNSDSKLATQKAVKTFVENKLTSAVTLKGPLDASTNPNYPSGKVGDQYRITVAGKVGGVNGVLVEVGDVIECYVASPSGDQSSVGSNWSVLQSNVSKATESTLGLTQFASKSETEERLIDDKSVTPADLTSFPMKRMATIGDGTSTLFTIVDNLNTIDKVASVRDASTDEQILVDIKYTLNTTILTFGVAPSVNSYKAVIIG